MIKLEIGQQIVKNGRIGLVVETQIMPGREPVKFSFDGQGFISNGMQAYQRAKVEWLDGGWTEGSSEHFIS